MQKTVRFYEESIRDMEALAKLKQYRKYGFDNERSMIIAAIECYDQGRENVPGFTAEADMFAERIADILHNKYGTGIIATEIEDESSMSMEKEKAKKNTEKAVSLLKGFEF